MLEIAHVNDESARPVIDLAGKLDLGPLIKEMGKLAGEHPQIVDQLASLCNEVACLRKTLESSIERREEQDSFASKLLLMLEKQSDDGFYKTFLQRPVEKLIDLRELVLAEADTPTLDEHLVEALEAFNIGTVSAHPGTAFDPAHHEAVDVVSVADESDVGRVVEVLRRGYLRGSSLMRPAQVRVAQLARGEEEGHEEAHRSRFRDQSVVGVCSGSIDRPAIAVSEHRREVIDPHRCLVPSQRDRCR